MQTYQEICAVDPLARSEIRRVEDVEMNTTSGRQRWSAVRSSSCLV